MCQHCEGDIMCQHCEGDIMCQHWEEDIMCQHCEGDIMCQHWEEFISEKGLYGGRGIYMMIYGRQMDCFIANTITWGE